MLHRRGPALQDRHLGPGNCSVISWSKRTGVVGAVRVVAKTDAIQISGYVTTSAAIVPVKADSSLHRGMPGTSLLDDGPAPEAQAALEGNL
jgi:hypothetical protein